MRERGRLDQDRESSRQGNPGHRVSRPSFAPKGLCYCSGVRIITRLFVACAAVALLAACLNVDPLNSGFSGDDSNDDVPSSLDISIASEEAMFGFTEVRVGVAPAVISVVCLPKMRAGDARSAFLRGNRAAGHVRFARLGDFSSYG